MAHLLDNFIASLRPKRKPRPTETIGAAGTAVFGGFIQSDEKSSLLQGAERYRTYSNILTNVSIVAAGTRYFQNLVAKASWSFEPGEGDPDGRFAELTEQALTQDPATPFHRIVRRAAMYRFYGFSIQEWTARRRDDGMLTFKDIAPRAQRTIEQWDIDDEGAVIGAIQRSPQTLQTLYLPRQKIVYLVDDTLDDSPEGLGLFRQLVASSERLSRYEQLEGFGFETDLRGIPIGRGPFAALADLQSRGELSAADRAALEKPIRDFIKGHIRSEKLGLLLDSSTFETSDDKAAPSPQRQWDVELLKAGSTSFAENAAAIERVNREMARVLGVEQLLLGSDGKGSLALSRDKTQSFFLIVDSTLKELCESFEQDLITRLFQLNGWPEDARPTVKPEAVNFKDIEQIGTVLRDMATAGAILGPDDPAIGEVRDLLGLSRADTSAVDIDAALGDEIEGAVDDPEEEMPDAPE